MKSGILELGLVFSHLLVSSGAASIGAVGKGEQIHAWVLKSGSSSNKSICNVLTPCILGVEV